MSNQHYYKQKSSANSFLLLPGLNGGVDSPLMQDTYIRCQERGSVLAVDYPFYVRGMARASEGLREEVSLLQTAYAFLKQELPNSHITIIGKSLGGIVIANWLEQYGKPDVSVALLAFDRGEQNMKAKPFEGRLKVVIQGEHDSYGNGRAIIEELATYAIGAEVIEIPGVDHSYRPNGENAALDALFTAIDSMDV